MREVIAHLAPSLSISLSTCRQTAGWFSIRLQRIHSKFLPKSLFKNRPTSNLCSRSKGWTNPGRLAARANEYFFTVTPKLFSVYIAIVCPRIQQCVSFHMWRREGASWMWGSPVTTEVCVLGVPLDSCHQPGARNFAVASRVLDDLCTGTVICFKGS
jgi:hypothetical protein